jgi:hypothetical protein
MPTVVPGRRLLSLFLGNDAGQGVAQGASAAHKEGQGAHRAGVAASCGARTRARGRGNRMATVRLRQQKGEPALVAAARQQEGGAALGGARQGRPAGCVTVHVLVS